MILLALMMGLATGPVEANLSDLLPKGTLLLMNDRGRIKGCRPPEKTERTASFDENCRKIIEGQGKGRSSITIGDTSSWVRAEDYPSSAVKNNEFGITLLTVTIGVDGSINDCTISSSSGYPDLDDAACHAILRRGKFLPALDPTGTPILSKYSRQVIWRATGR